MYTHFVYVYIKNTCIHTVNKRALKFSVLVVTEMMTIMAEY